MASSVRAYTELSSGKINNILKDTSVALLQLQTKTQKEQKSVILPENLKLLEDFEYDIRKFLEDNLHYVAQKILIRILIEKGLFLLCDYFKEEYDKVVDNLVKDEKVEKLIQETFKLKFEDLKKKFPIKNEIVAKDYNCPKGPSS